MSKQDVINYIKNYRLCIKLYRMGNKRNDIYLNMAEDYWNLFMPVLEKHNIKVKPQHRIHKRLDLKDFFNVA